MAWKLGRGGAFQLERATQLERDEAATGLEERTKMRLGSKSMQHNVDKVCKHKMLRWLIMSLDPAVSKCSELISRVIFVNH